MIELNDELKDYLSRKYNVKKELIYHFGFDEKTKVYKMIAHTGANTMAFFIQPIDVRFLKIKQIQQRIREKKYKKI